MKLKTSLKEGPSYALLNLVQRGGTRVENETKIQFMERRVYSILLIMVLFPIAAHAQDIGTYISTRIRFGLDSAYSLYVKKSSDLNLELDEKVKIEIFTKYLKVLDYLNDEHKKNLNNKYFDIYTNKRIENDYLDLVVAQYKCLMINLRADSKFEVKDYYGCIDDFSLMKECVNHRFYPKSLYRTAIAYLALRKKDEGCRMLSEAGQLGYRDAYKAIEDFCK